MGGHSVDQFCRHVDAVAPPFSRLARRKYMARSCRATFHFPVGIIALVVSPAQTFRGPADQLGSRFPRPSLATSQFLISLGAVG